MTFLIADTFTDSLARLTGDEQKAVKTTAFDLQIEPVGPGHELPQARQGEGQEILVRSCQRDIRAHRPPHGRRACCSATSPTTTTPTPGQSDGSWRRTRRREPPRWSRSGRRSGRSSSRDYVADGSRWRPSRRFEAAVRQASDDELLGYGVPAEWVGDVVAATEDRPAGPRRHLPAEAAEAVLELATGGNAVAKPSRTGGRADRPVRPPRRAAPFPRGHERRGAPARSRLALGQMDGVPAPRAAPAGRRATSTARPGSPALRARARPSWRYIAPCTWRAPYPKAAGAAGDLLRTAGATRSAPTQTPDRQRAPAARAHRGSLAERPRRSAAPGADRPVKLASRADVDLLIRRRPQPQENTSSPCTSSSRNGITWSTRGSSTTWEAYRDVARLGRKTRLPEAQRAVLWSIYERVSRELTRAGLDDRCRLFQALAATYCRS